MTRLYNKVERLCRMSHSLDQKCQGNIFECRSWLILLQGKRMRGAAAILVLLVAVPAAYATDYRVGDASGWTTGPDYTTWTSGKTFTVGDNLVFNYGSTHSVDVVSASDYNGCSAGNAIRSFTGGNTVFPLTQAGNFYFLCPTAGHCSQGMKLSVTVAASGGSTPSTPTATPPSSGGSPGSPTPPGTPPNTRTPTTTSPPGGSGAVGGFAHFSGVLLGASLMVAPLLGLVG